MIAKTTPELRRLQPFGLTLTGDVARPLLLLKDESGEWTLPVALNPVEAGMTLSQTQQLAGSVTPHQVAHLLLESLGMKIQRCVFQEVRGGHQIVALELENHPRGTRSLHVRAEEAMSLCLHLNIPIFATADFVTQSRSLVSELQEQTQHLKLNPRLLKRPHTYLM